MGNRFFSSDKAAAKDPEQLIGPTERARKMAESMNQYIKEHPPMKCFKGCGRPVAVPFSVCKTCLP